MAVALTSSTLPTSLSLTKSEKPPRNPSKVVLVSCRSTSAMDMSASKSTNFYEILSLSSKSASVDNVKRAFRSMALQLSDPVRREEYNYSLGLVLWPRSEGCNRMVARRRWEEQVMESKRRSSRREGRRRVGTFGKSHEV